MDQSNHLPSSAANPDDLTETANVGETASSGVTWGITIISLMTLILTSLGYGVSLGVETVFGLPHESVYTSVLDLIGLSVYALITLILRLGEITWQTLFEQNWLPWEALINS